MRHLSAMWQRHPILFALGLAVLTVAGLIVMLGDAAVWKGAGFALSALPSLLAAFGYRNHRRRRGASWTS